MKKKKKNKKNNKLLFQISMIVILLLLVLSSYLFVKDGLSNASEKDEFEINCDSKKTIQLFEITDENGSEWKSGSGSKDGTGSENKINIFNKEFISPEDHGVYKFSIKNNVENLIVYNIKFIESNPYKINLKYRLKKNSKYINKEWMDIEKIAISNAKLALNKNDEFSLEWRWISNSNDNEVAGLIEKYNLKMEIEAEA